MKKTIAIALATIALTACGDKDSPLLTKRICVDGVTYLFGERQLAAKVDRDGRMVACTTGSR